MGAKMKLTSAMIAAVIAAGHANAQDAGNTSIDVDLLGQLDFRAPEFKVCFDQETCQVGGVKISGFRLDTETQDFEPAALYWDPIDGLGVTQGGQNDEIDFDERIVVEFQENRSISRVWLSDLFISEHRRYGGVSVSGKDEEHARMELLLNGETVGDIRMSGKVDLPGDPFDVLVSANLLEAGDLRRRVTVDDETLLLIVPGGETGSDIVIDISQGAVDDEKKDIFEGIPTVEIDITGLLSEFIDAPLFAGGTHNAQQILAILENDAALEQMRAAARDTRMVSDRSNGEIGTVLDAPVTVDSLIFYAPFDTSNDFSVAGVVFEDPVPTQ